MNNLIKKDKVYTTWIEKVEDRFKRSQIRSHVKVNDEMLRFYWTLGRDMDELKDTYAWGSKFYEIISKDLHISRSTLYRRKQKALAYAGYYFFEAVLPEMAGKI